ncbi:hypothetical protein Ancab_020483 [Ancistrocladus abbreviatus]
MPGRIALWHTRNAATSVLSKYRQPTSLFSHLLHLDSYCEVDVSSQVYAYNRAIDGRLNSGSLTSAIQLFDEMPIRDPVSWNLLISGHKRHGHPYEALELYGQMVFEGVRETTSTLSCVLSICSNHGYHFEGLQVHCRVISLGFGMNLYVGSSVVDLYMNMGLVQIGMRVLDEMTVRNTAVWNLVCRGFGQLSLWEEVLGLYLRMKVDGVEPNEITLSYLINACCNGRFVPEGQQLHCHVVKAGLVESNLFIANALVDFYCACGSLLDALRSFEVVPAKDVISWNSIVAAHADHGLLFDALQFFVCMQLWEKKPSVHSFVCLLNLCSENKNLWLGKQFHCYVLKQGFDCWNFYLQSALIDMYGKCHEIESSVNVYESWPEKTIECCNTLMTSLLHCSIIEDVLELFRLMVDEGIGFDEVSLSTTLKALSMSSLASLTSCKVLHCCASKSGFISDVAVSCSLIDVYSKKGDLESACRVFTGLSSPNVVCFTSIINGYGRNGLGRECLELLEAMIQKGLQPDRVTILCILTGCNHSGLVEEGRVVFDSMKKLHGVEPDRQHYSCMVDLLGRAGLLCEAEELLDKSPVKNDSVMWSSLLRSCRVHQNEVVGRRVANRLMDLEPRDPAACLQASIFYFEVGDYESSMRLQEMGVAEKVIREIGCSLIEVSSHCHG